MATLIDSYSNSNISYDSPISNATYHGQSFTCSQTLPIYSCTFYLKKDAGATGNLYAMLAEHSGTYGTSSEAGGYGIASSGDVSIDTVGTSYTAITFTFTGTERYIMQSGTYYTIVVFRYSGGTGLVYTGTDNTSPTHSGNKFIGGTPYATHDLAFAVYGELFAPTVTTQACSSVTHNSAVGNGNITSTGGSVTRRGFCYKTGTSGDPTVADSTAYDDGTFGTGAYTKGLTGLSASTDYRVRAYAVNSVGTSYGITAQLTTQSADAPVVSTTTTSRLDRKCVIFGGNVTDQGTETVTERGVYYGTDEFSQTTKLTSTSGLGTYSIFLSGLTPNTLYYFKAFATSSIGTSYGDILNFKTAKFHSSVGDKHPLPSFELS
ncbi:MAG: hypothetical protein PHE21_00040 [Candidatus Dojkabacteria bacterium]|nr:hypothetical protein [Candidatus Dojkabacteria bacterium]